MKIQIIITFFNFFDININHYELWQSSLGCKMQPASPFILTPYYCSPYYLSMFSFSRFYLIYNQSGIGSRPCL